METRKNKFGKIERIKSKKVISALFDRNSLLNKSFLVFPFKVVYFKDSTAEIGDYSPQILVSVSKRKFKKAVDRNTLKRRTKEAYRLNKLKFSAPFKIAFIYVANEILEYQAIEKAMVACLSRLK